MDKRRTNILFISMAVTAVVILIGTGAYAYYRSTISGTTSGTIAKWSFKANNQSESFNLNLGTLYPGKNGTYNIELSAEDSDLDVYYELYFDEVDWNVANSSYLYFDPNYTVDIALCQYRGVYGTIPAGTKISIPLYYNWPYNEDSREYMADGSTRNDNIIIVAQQLTAYSSSIPMYLVENFDSNAYYPENMTGYIAGGGCEE